MSKSLRILITVLVIAIVAAIGVYLYINNSKSSADVLSNSLSYFNVHHITDPGSATNGHHHTAIAQVTGTVTSSANNAVVPNVEIVFKSITSTNQVTVKSGINGTYSANLLAGTYMVTANGENSATYNKSYQVFTLSSLAASYLPITQDIQLKPAAVNLVKNGDFELGNTSWNLTSTFAYLGSRGVSQIVTSPVCYLNTGSCVRMQKNNSSQVYASQPLAPLQANQNYQFSAKYKTVNTGNKGYAYIYLRNVADGKVYGSVKTLVVDGDWKEIKSQFTAPANAATGKWSLLLVGYLVPNGSILYDNVSLTAN